jgi:hypothetical protein
MKTLYFDTDGTILIDNENSVKPELSRGGFESAVRAAGFVALVCIGNFGSVANDVQGSGVDYDEIGVLFSLCRGAFQDEVWLRSRVALIDDPQNRTEFIDFTSDWCYVDDLAHHYMERAGKSDIYEEYVGSRILAPDPKGDGRDILDWLRVSAL